MIRQQAFTENGKMLKGALHCHTTRSDGNQTPEEAMQLYKNGGYDFVALTDHKKYNYVNYAPETDILLIPGMEYDAMILKDEYGRICHHTVCLGPLKEDGNGFNQDDFGPARPDVANNELYQGYLDEIHAKNNITIHAHPEWSNTPLTMFDCLKGNTALEIYNHGGVLGYDMDKDNGLYWDQLLAQGKRVWGVATDDAHGTAHFCGGWVMVNCEKNVNSVLEALCEGRFYASTGPEIYDFYVDDENTAHIKCSPAKQIILQGTKHPHRLYPRTHRMEEIGLVTEAEFKLETKTGLYEYCRFTVVDENGKKAWTNPIFLK